MKTFYRYLLLLIMCCVGLTAKAQATTYPFQLNAVMLPPYTNCLGDYMSNGRMQLTAILRDMSRYNGQPVKFSLHMRVKQGNAVYLETESHTQYVLNTAQMINQLNVRQLFNLDNPSAHKTGTLNVKQGLKFAENGWCLPEGSYEFVFQMFDYYNGKVPLSEPFSVFTYLQQAEAPIGIQPIDGACGIGTEPGLLANGVQFQWMTPIAIGPSTTNRKYSLEIYENGKYSSDGAPMFSKYELQTGQGINAQTYNTTFAFVQTTAGGIQPYSESEGAKTYKWRVKVSDAKSVENAASDYSAYKNGGYSEWYTFTYGPCEEEKPLQLSEPMAKTTEKVDKNIKVKLVEAKGVEKGTTANLKWELSEGSCNYFNVYYYKQGEETSAAERLEITGNEIELSGIEPGVTYECYVVAYNNSNGDDNLLKSQKSNIGTFKIEVENKEDACETNLEKVECDAEKLVKDLKNGETFKANGRLVKLKDAKNNGGVYTGDATITTEIFKNSFGLKAEMFDVKIHNVNGENELCEGIVKVKQTEHDDDPGNLLLNINELLGKLSGGSNTETQEKLGEEVDDLGNISSDKWGSLVTYNGKLYAVSTTGSVNEVGPLVEPSNLCDLPSHAANYGCSLDMDYGYFIFKQATGLNGNDYDPYVDFEPGVFNDVEMVRRGYTYISNGNFYAPWISMVQGDLRKVKAVFQPRQGGDELDMSKVEFYCHAGTQVVQLNAENVGNNTFYVSIPGGTPKKALDIFVRINAKIKTTKQSGSSGNDLNNASDADDSENAESGNDAKNSHNSQTDGNDQSGLSDNGNEEVVNDCQEARTIGFARIYTLKSMTKKILLVPVASVDKDNVESQVSDLTITINKSFAPLGKKFEFDVFESSFNFDVNKDGFNTSDGASFFTNETEEMKLLQSEFAKVLSAEEQSQYSACLFLLPIAKKENVGGYMPRGQGRGYIFVGDNLNNFNADIVSHELCHGLFGMEHTFNYSSVGQGAVPENLMDYSTKSDRYLSKYYQWLASDTTMNVILAFDKVDDGENLLVTVGKILFKGVANEIVNVSCEAFEKGYTSSEEVLNYALKDENGNVSWSKLGERAKNIGENIASEAKDEVTGLFKPLEVLSTLYDIGSAIYSLPYECEEKSKEESNLADQKLAYKKCMCEDGIDQVLWPICELIASPFIGDDKSNKDNNSNQSSNKNNSNQSSDKNNNNQSSNTENKSKKDEGNQSTTASTIRDMASDAVEPCREKMVEYATTQIFTMFGVEDKDVLRLLSSIVSSFVEKKPSQTLREELCDWLFEHFLPEETQYTDTYVKAWVNNRNELTIELNAKDAQQLENVYLAKQDVEGNFTIVECGKTNALITNYFDIDKEEKKQLFRDNSDPVILRRVADYVYDNMESNEIYLQSVDLVLERDEPMTSLFDGTYEPIVSTAYKAMLRTDINQRLYKYKVKLDCDKTYPNTYIFIKAAISRPALNSDYRILSHIVFANDEKLKTKFDQTVKTVKYIGEQQDVFNNNGLVFACPDNTVLPDKPGPNPPPTPKKTPKKEVPPTPKYTITVDELAVYTNYCYFLFNEAYINNTNEQRIDLRFSKWRVQKCISCALTEEVCKSFLDYKVINLSSNSAKKAIYDFIIKHLGNPEQSEYQNKEYQGDSYYSIFAKIHDKVAESMVNITEDLTVSINGFNGEGKKVLPDENALNGLFLDIYNKKSLNAYKGPSYPTLLDIARYSKDFYMLPEQSACKNSNYEYEKCEKECGECFDKVGGCGDVVYNKKYLELKTKLNNCTDYKCKTNVNNEIDNLKEKYGKQ